MKNIDWKIPWSGVGVKYTQDEIEAVINCMKTADPLTQGPYQTEFENKFKNYIGSRSAFAVSSATAALELAAIMSGIREGDEVICPAHTFCASAIPFARTGATIKWADIELDTRIVSAKTIEPLITDKTKVIIVVHLYGLVVDLDPILELAKNKNILIVEDVAQAPGASYKGKKVGSIGDFGCFSFHTHKNMNTLGEGGILTVNKEELIKLVPGLRHNGVRSFKDQDVYWQPAMSNVDFDIEGVWPYNFCIGEVQCALGSKMLDRLDQMNHVRKEKALKVIERLKDYKELKFQYRGDEDRENVFHLLVAYYEGGEFDKTTDDFIETIVNDYKIKVIRPYYPLYKYPIFAKSKNNKADCKVLEYYFERIVAFPFHQWMSEEEFDYMIESIINTLKKLRNKNEKN